MTGPSAAEQIETALGTTVVRELMTVAEATHHQFRLVDLAQQVMGSDEVFTHDMGQVRALATVGFGGGGRPRSTAAVERVLADFFEVEDCALVHGAGTGAIRSMLNAGLEPGDRVVVHDAHLYKTTDPSMRHMGLDIVPIDMGDPEALRAELRGGQPAGVYLQHVPQRLGDDYDIESVVTLAREELGDTVRILSDDNYAVMRASRIAVQMGADTSAFSLFKLLSTAQIGAVLGSGDLVQSVRRDQASAGCQVQGADAMEALRMLVYAPVSLAIQNEVVLDATAQINALVDGGDLPFVHRAIAAQPGIRSVVLVFDEPVAEAFLQSVWRNGSPSQSVGEEARYEFLPLFTYLTSTFLKGWPGLERHAIRINPMRGGTETIVRVLRAALDDHEFRRAADAVRLTTPTTQ
jgi:hypothetical protein